MASTASYPSARGVGLRCRHRTEPSRLRIIASVLVPPKSMPMAAADELMSLFIITSYRSFPPSQFGDISSTPRQKEIAAGVLLQRDLMNYRSQQPCRKTYCDSGNKRKSATQTEPSYGEENHCRENAPKYTFNKRCNNPAISLAV